MAVTWPSRVAVAWPLQGRYVAVTAPAASHLPPPLQAASATAKVMPSGDTPALRIVSRTESTWSVTWPLHVHYMSVTWPLRVEDGEHLVRLPGLLARTEGGVEGDDVGWHPRASHLVQQIERLLPPARCVAVTWPLRSRYVAVTWPLHGHYMTVTEPLRSASSHLAVTWPLRGRYGAVTERLLPPCPLLAR